MEEASSWPARYQQIAAGVNAAAPASQARRIDVLGAQDERLRACKGRGLAYHCGEWLWKPAGKEEVVVVAKRRGGKPMSAEEQARVIAGLRRDHAERLTGYRERALRLFPHVCARCGREFSGKRLKELTVHHKDHDHQNNPPDGSNWELLCLYCHDFEHEKSKLAGHYQTVAEDLTPGPSIFRPFEQLFGSED